MPFKNSLITEFEEGANKAVLHDALEYTHPTHGVITVQVGFETDFASVPGYVLLPGIVPRIGPVRKAAVVHDWIYRGHEVSRFTRRQADKIFLDAALECGMARWRAWVAYIGVRLGGWASWEGD